MKKVNKILAINFGGIGDEILFLPTLISLKKEYPNASITLALEPRSKGVKNLTSVIDDIMLVDVKRKNKYIELLKFIFYAFFKRFDIGITAGSNKFMSIILWFTGAKIRCGYDTGKLSQILLTHAVKLNKQQYAAEMYHDLISDLTEYATFLPQIDIEPQQKIPNTILIHPGVSKMSVNKGIIKTVPPEIWAKTIELLVENKKDVILAGGPDDKECIAQITTLIQPPKTDGGKFTNYYGQTKNLTDLAKLIGKAEKFLCADSAPLHVAVAMGTRTYAIFGPTDDRKLIPDCVTAIKANDKCELKPCLWDRRQKTCPKLDCLKISAEDIVNILLK